MKFNTRTCIITKQKKNKFELLRICVVNNKLVIDEKYSLLNHGYYLLPNIDVYNKVYNHKIIEKKLQISLTNDDYKNLKNCILAFNKKEQ